MEKLRPQKLSEFIGQAKVKENLAVAIEAAKSRGEAMDHVMLYGPPGLGKTTLANIIANELGVYFQSTAAPLLQIKGDLTAILTNIRDKQVLFIDEVHRLQPALEEILYPALEDYKLDIIIGQGPVGAHAHAGVEAFHICRRDHARGVDFGAAASRFRASCCGWSFIPTPICTLLSSARRRFWEWRFNKEGAAEIASRSRGTPRIANRLAATSARLCAGAQWGKDRFCLRRRRRCRCWKSTCYDLGRD